jgi:hypothetical protein
VLQFQCRRCGFHGPTLEGHKCVPAAAPPDRLEKARAVLSEASARTGVECRPPEPVLMQDRHLGAIKAAQSAKERQPPGFDRNAYHKVYMREYMRAYRAHRKGAGAGKMQTCILKSPAPTPILGQTG